LLLNMYSRNLKHGPDSGDLRFEYLPDMLSALSSLASRTAACPLEVRLPFLPELVAPGLVLFDWRFIIRRPSIF
jgi:hypothetical protein